MASSMDFPYNCSTNVYTLVSYAGTASLSALRYYQNDFSDIAYIVCTLATPPTQDPAAFTPTPEHTLARLRKTERQFREASILAALDVENRQLYTFYKRVDIADQKEQRTLLNKFGHVLRSNTCTIAYKSAGRLSDLMKPAQPRLYRLFTAAIISSIKLLPNGDSALQPVGPNLYLVERASSGSEVDQFEHIHRWSLYRIDLQVVSSGHIILTIANDNNLAFLRMQELVRCTSYSDLAEVGLKALYLAPIGRIARLVVPSTDAQNNSNNNYGEQHISGSQHLDPRKELWKEMLPLWLKEHMSTTIDFKDVQWIEAEVPIEEADVESNDGQTPLSSDAVNFGSIIWRTLLWPAQLCFLFHGNSHLPDRKASRSEDPMQFVQDWIAGTAKGATTEIKSEPRRRDVNEEDDEPLFAEEGAFDDPEHFQPFGPPAFPASQTIYPTPPDIIMTHTTPGLSSVDGVAMTPANFPQRALEMGQAQDEEMHDFEEVPTASGMSGYYDEDLFEEMPDDNFGQEGPADEPNWDFFDRPGIESKPASMSNRASNRKLSESIEELGGPGGNAGEDNANNAESTMSGHGHTTPTLLDVATKNRIFPIQEGPSSPVRQDKIEQGFQVPSKPEPPLWLRSDSEKISKDTSSRRRSSVYDGLSLSSTSNRDSRYAANGDYWFDPSPAAQLPKSSSLITSLFRRSPSSSSGSDESMISQGFSSGVDISGNEAPPLRRQWTEYLPGSPSVISHHSEAEKRTAQQEVQQLLNLFRSGVAEPPTESDFDLTELSHKVPLMSTQKFMHVANVLVDQMTQTFLISYEEHQDQAPTLWDDHMDVVADLSGITATANTSSLTQLANLKADSAKIQGRVIKIPSTQISMKRTERALIASTSILGFWDTLNLQPESGTKDVTAICLHPNAQNVAEGCLTLLNRLSDTYTSCALGAHTIGRIPGLTETGLISWGLGRAPVSSDTTLPRTVHRVGNAIANASDLKGTVLVYMISTDDSAESYLETSHAFYSLFESFTQALGDRQDVSDIALQIIPQGFVANAETLVIPPQTAYLKLAIEVYNRLPPAKLTATPGACGSAVILARSDTSIHFQLTQTYGSPLMKNGPCLHLAYSVSCDNRWITAAWTDGVGRIALTMSYCISIRHSGRKRSRQDILKDMWEVSHDLMGKVRGSWRLAVVKQGVYDPPELVEWHQIFEGSPNASKRCALILLAAQLNPALKIFLPPNHGRGAQGNLQNMYGTPASTPQASMTSPDQMVPATPTPGGSSIMNAPTPPDPGFDPNGENDLTLLDPSEESWGIILPFGVNQTNSLTELRPALTTGMLMKRKGARIEDGYVMIEISILSLATKTPESSSEMSPDDALEDVLKQYRDLVTLGVTRGCVDPFSECLPWHIATATRGAQILGQVM